MAGSIDKRDRILAGKATVEEVYNEGKDELYKWRRVGDGVSRMIRGGEQEAKISAFVDQAIQDRTIEDKIDLGLFINQSALAAQIGSVANSLRTVVLQASYLHHVFDNHGLGGVRKDRYPVVPDDLLMALMVLNEADQIEFNGTTRKNGNLLVKFTKEIAGIQHKVIAEVRPGKRNRNLAVYNYYKR